MALPTKGGTIDFVANNVGIEGDAEGILAELRNQLEHGARVEETEVDSMVIDGIRIDNGVEFRSARTASRRRPAASASASTRSTTRRQIRTRARS